MMSEEFGEQSLRWSDDDRALAWKSVEQTADELDLVANRRRAPRLVDDGLHIHGEVHIGYNLYAHEL